MVSLGITHTKENITDDLTILLSESKNVTKGTIINLHGLPGSEMDNFRDFHQLFAARGYRIISFNYPGLWQAPGTFSIKASHDAAHEVVKYVQEAYDGNIHLFAQSFGGYIAVKLLQQVEGIDKIFYRAPLPGLEYFLENQLKLQQLTASLALLVQSGVVNIDSPDLETMIEEREERQFSDLVQDLSERGVDQHVVIGQNDEILDSHSVASGYEAATTVEIYDDLSHNAIARDQWIELITKADVFYQS